MFDKLKSSWGLFTDSIRVFGKYPLFIVPLVLSWCVYAPIVLWMQFFAPWATYSGGQVLLIVFLVLWAFALSLSLSCAWLLELLQQVESGKEPALGPAWQEVLGRDLKAILPLSLVRAVLWFILTLIEAIFSRRKNSDSGDFNAESAARALGDDGSPFSWARLGFRYAEKALRMVMFLILPAITWEDKGLTDATKRGFKVLRKMLLPFVAGFALTEAAASIIFIPPAIMFYVGKQTTFPDWAWYLCILYLCFATSYSIYLEQMYTAELFMWYLFWEKAQAAAQAAGETAPELNAVPMPSLLDGIPGLLVKPGPNIKPPEPPAPSPTGAAAS